ncbi:MAG: phosphoribosylformylglycinamidine synthase subunit PurQ [Chitinophagales bacterium]|nr:phosphoribosylformylglycinamidine synthase subunit PurQ [Chitinophagales bacterium]
MKFGVVIFPGSNCDRDMIHVLQDVMGFDVKPLWHKEEKLAGFTSSDCIVLPGGFSYGDYLRSGAIARFSPIMDSVIRFANEGGTVMGICNGFQILCEAGLLPGALLRNKNQQFICDNIYIKAEHADTRFTNAVPMGKALKIPIAHAEGRYFADETTLKELYSNNQVLFKYCDSQGNVTEEANVNGALDNIAGICNASKNVFGMMPHPERASEMVLGNTDGLYIFESLKESIFQHA